MDQLANCAGQVAPFQKIEKNGERMLKLGYPDVAQAEISAAQGESGDQGGAETLCNQPLDFFNAGQLDLDI